MTFAPRPQRDVARLGAAYLCCQKAHLVIAIMSVIRSKLAEVA